MEANVKEIMSRLDMQHIRDFAFKEMPDLSEIERGTYDEHLERSK